MLAELEGSGLRGRGGAGFSMGKKAAFIPKGAMDKYLCCNADESEPGTFKDRLLMQKNPHLLVEGCIIGSIAAGANRAFIFIRGEYEAQADILDAAVAEAYAKGYLGRGHLRLAAPRSSWWCTAARAPTSAARSPRCSTRSEGKRGNPRLKPPFPANQGLYQGPTLINNVETLCNTPLIIEKGADWFKALGVGNSTGTKIVSVSGNVQRPGNYEIELGITGRELVEDLAGGTPDGTTVKCWFPGGSSAPVLLDEHLDLPYTFEDMAEAGSMLGSGAIIVVDDSQPIVPLALRLAEFYRHESCGKCVPCREGTNWTVKMLERMDEGEGTPMDIQIMAEVQENIIGNCLCVLGRLDGHADPLDGQALPARVRGAHGARPRGRPTVQALARSDGAARRSAQITFEIDGREVTAPEGTMLVDAAKHGDVEIPYFCYERKLGPPVGACRMCLVEIEGMPKLQTSCSTPVKEGMVVNTTSDRVKHAQEAVVEFLLVNHPLDCPVCDKGGECPLQDISYGWGGGKSRFIEPKRHFRKPLELSPAGGHRPRALHPLLPLRALLPGGGRGLPAGVPRARRPHLRGHPRRPPVRGPVQRQHRGAVPGGRAHLDRLPLPRAPVGHRGRGLGLHALPEPVQRDLHRARRREGAARARARERRGGRRLAVRQGPLRLPGHPRQGAPARADGARRRRAARGVVGARAGRGRRRR